MNKRIKILLAALAGFSAEAFSHESTVRLPETMLQGLGAVTYHSDDVVDAPEAWMIPGAFLGGEALPTEQGLVVDDVQVFGHWRLDRLYAVSAKLTSHTHSGESELELEDIWLSFSTESVLSGSTVAIGKMSSEVSPTANYHASESPFSESSVLSDIFFGRHTQDTGLRFKHDGDRHALGIEIWNGESWPGSAGEGAANVFAKYSPQVLGFQLDLGAWAYEGQAQGRRDERYGAGHSHGGETIESESFNYAFDGDLTMLGLHAGLSRELRALTLRSELEWIQLKQDGELYNELNQRSGLSAEYDGLRALVAVDYLNHSLYLQHEVVRLKNTFLDSVGLLFVEESGLNNDGLEPSKTMVSWHWRCYKDITLRADWIADSTLDNTVDRFAVGLLWQHRFF